MHAKLLDVLSKDRDGTALAEDQPSPYSCIYELILSFRGPEIPLRKHPKTSFMHRLRCSFTKIKATCKQGWVPKAAWSHAHHHQMNKAQTYQQGALQGYVVVLRSAALTPGGYSWHIANPKPWCVEAYRGHALEKEPSAYIQSENNSMGGITVLGFGLFILF